MNLGRILTFSLTLAMVTAAHAKYDRALDGKTKIWRNPPQSNLHASWSGDRDEKGYATGRGTLTWFRTTHSWETGSLLPATKYIQVAQYEGKMVDGKLEGSVVSTDAAGKTRHAKFADGRKTTDWIAGSGSKSSKRADQEVSKHAEPKAPAEGPAPAPKLEEHVAEPPTTAAATPATAAAATTTTTAVATPAPKVKQSVAAEQPIDASSSPSSDSLRSLAMPPSSLRVASLNETSKQTAAPSPESAETDAPAEASPEPQAPAPAAPTALNNEDAQTVAALDSEFHSAVKTNDARTIDRILADDFVLMHGAGAQVSKADILKQARDKQGRYEHHEAEPGSQNVRVWRDTAVVTETLWVKGAEQGKPVDEKVAVTETYARTPDGWRYVSGQAVPAAK